MPTCGSASGGHRQPLNTSGQDERGARYTSADRVPAAISLPTLDIELEALLGRMSAPIRSGDGSPPARAGFLKCVPYLPVSDYVERYG